MKLMIAIPCMDFVHTDFMKSLLALTKRLDSADVDYEVRIESGTLVYLAREALANAAISEKFTHVLWLDSDMVFEPDVFDRLMANGKALVSAAYQARRDPHRSCIITKFPDERPETYPDEPFEIDGCGFGCVLVSTEMLRDLNLSFWTCFMPRVTLGEDLAFCDRAKKLGYELWCDPRIRVGHIGHIPVWPVD